MDISSKLSETLKELMVLRELTEQEISDKTGIPISCISVYVRGMQAPYIDTFIKLADYFNCSADYLLGRTDKIIENKKYSNMSFVTKFNVLLDAKNCKTFKDFKLEGISKSSFYEWKRGKSLPTLEKLVMLADYFDCSVDYILGREN